MRKILIFALSVLGLTISSYGQSSEDCNTIKEEIKLYYSAFINSPTTQDKLKSMSKTEQNQYRIGLRNKLQSRYGKSCFPNIAPVKVSCAEIKKDVRELFSALLAHPNTETRLSQMSQLERKDFEKETKDKLINRYGGDCFEENQVPSTTRTPIRTKIPGKTTSTPKPPKNDAEVPVDKRTPIGEKGDVGDTKTPVKPARTSNGTNKTPSTNGSNPSGANSNGAAPNSNSSSQTSKCSETMKNIDILFSGYINHPTNRKRISRMSKTEASAYRKEIRDKLNSFYGKECFNGQKTTQLRGTCKDVKRDVKRFYSGFVNHPTTRKRLAQMSRQERKAYKQAMLNDIKARYGAGCY